MLTSLSDEWYMGFQTNRGFSFKDLRLDWLPCDAVHVCWCFARVASYFARVAYSTSHIRTQRHLALCTYALNRTVHFRLQAVPGDALDKTDMAGNFVPGGAQDKTDTAGHFVSGPLLASWPAGWAGWARLRWLGWAGLGWLGYWMSLAGLGWVWLGVQRNLVSIT